ncbi:MAG: hypothetical protein CL878_11870 [Dehalococcoidia bacterium]|nr:hypothetical protein [Dehalococcoidia bacterium]
MTRLFARGNLGVTLSVLAILVFVARAILDWGFVPEFTEAASPGTVAGATLLYMVLVGGWIWAVLAASHGARAGLIGALVSSALLSLGIGIGTALAFCPTPCRTIWPLMEITNWAGIIVGLAACVALGFELWRPTIRSGEDRTEGAG